MAPVNPSFCLQNRTDHTAQTFRLTNVSPSSGPTVIGSTSPAGGVIPAMGNQMIVTGTAGMTVNVDTGMVNMPSSTAWEGMYTGVNTALYSVTVPASNGTQWRQDYIVARQHDVALGDADNNWDIIDVAGTFANSSPGTLPSLPNNSVPLGIVKVVPNMTVTNGVGTVVDARIFAPLPGVLWTSSSAKPSTSCHEGTLWYETDTDQLGIIVNGTYKYLFITSNALVQIDTWHDTGSLQNGWSKGGFFKYRRTLENELAVAAQSINVGTTSDGTNILNAGGIPSAYQPVNNHRVPVWCDALHVQSGSSDLAAGFQFGSDGSVSCYGIGTVATRVDCYIRIPLDV